MGDTMPDFWGMYAHALWVWGVFVAVVLVMTALSVRFLRGLPEFEEKALMIRRAKRGGFAFVGIVSCAFTATALGISTGNVIAGMLLGMAVIGGGLPLFWALRLDDWNATFIVLSRLRHGRAFSLEEWRRDKAAAKERVRRTRRWATPALMALSAWWFGVAIWAYCSGGREVDAALREYLLGERFQQVLAAPEVREVYVMGPAFLEGPIYQVIVEVQPGTTEAQADELVGRTYQLVAARKDRHIWRIYARAPHRAPMGRVYYVPEGMTLPPNADAVRPRPKGR